MLLAASLERVKIISFNYQLLTHMETRTLSFIQLTISQSLDYIFALTHANVMDFSPYENFHNEFNMPLFPKNINYFNELAYIGGQLRAFIDQHYYKGETGLFPFCGDGDNIIKEIRFVAKENRYYINEEQYFDNVTQQLYNSRQWDDFGRVEFPIQTFFENFIGDELYESTIEMFERELLLHRGMEVYIKQIDDIVHCYFQEEFPISVGE